MLPKRNPKKILRKQRKKVIHNLSKQVVSEAGSFAPKFEGASGNGRFPKQPLARAQKLEVESFATGSNFQPKTSNVIRTGNEIHIKPHGPFPELIVFYEEDEKIDYLFLKKSFLASPYGCLEKTIDVDRASVKVTLSCKGIILAEGVSNSKLKAEEMAVDRLVKKLHRTNYFIEAKSSYFPKDRVPSCVLSADPALSHIFKVVCLKKPYGCLQFPLSLTGAVQYVDSDYELWKYIEKHCEKEPKVELFVLNVEKSQDKIVREIGDKTGMRLRFLNGCSDRGVVVYREENVYSILEELLKCGGDNLKYHLYPPLSDSADVHPSDEDGRSHRGSGEKVEDSGGEVEMQQQKIPQYPWIGENLILMDVYNEMSKLAEPKEMLSSNVRDCPEMLSFIIEKKQDKVTGLITAEAFIDTKLVGRAKADTVEKAEKLAAKNALSNLMQYCYYIKGNPSYFGVNGSVPPFITSKRPGCETHFYWRPMRKDVNSRKNILEILRRFKTVKAQDLFFLEDIPLRFKRTVHEEADNQQNLSVREFGNNCLCVFKKLRPQNVIKGLLAAKGHKNEKYILIIPPSRYKLLRNPVRVEVEQKVSGQKEEDDDSRNILCRYLKIILKHSLIYYFYSL